MSFDIVWLQQQFQDVSGLSRIGQGGQKWVFGGTHSVEGPVVIKLFHPMTDPERALREVKAAQSVMSKRVPKVHGSGDLQSHIGTIIWVREQLIRGEDLRSRLRRGPLSAPELLRLALHALEALSAAERERIVHRDVKPDNILLAYDDSFWLLDFGLARHLNLESITATAAQIGVGTPGYIPIEQFRNQKKDIDSRSDLFSLGVTLYECAMGVNPFRLGARDALEMQRRIETQLLPPIYKAIDSRHDFQNLVLALTRIYREQRVPTAKDAYDWIQEICSNENIS